MALYYKIARLNGDDFRLPFNYADLLSHQGTLVSPEPIHLYDSPESASREGTWPLRLFLVEAHATRENGKPPHTTRLRVVSECDPTPVFGPNGEEVLRIIHQVRDLTRDQASQIAETTGADDDPQHDLELKLSSALHPAGLNTSYSFALWAVLQVVRTNTELPLEPAMKAVRRALLGAILEDHISASEKEALQASWASAMEGSA